MRPSSSQPVPSLLPVAAAGGALGIAWSRVTSSPTARSRLALAPGPFHLPAELRVGPGGPRLPGRVAGPSSGATEVCVRPRPGLEVIQAGSCSRALQPSDSSRRRMVALGSSQPGLHLSKPGVDGRAWAGVASSQGAYYLSGQLSPPGRDVLRSLSVPASFAAAPAHQPGRYPGPGWTQLTLVFSLIQACVSVHSKW